MSFSAENGRGVELETGRAAEPFIAPEGATLEEKEPAQLYHDGQSTPSLSGGDGKPDLQRGNVLPENGGEWEESKLPERGIHSLTHSVTGDSSRPLSEVEDDKAPFDITGGVSDENSPHESQLKSQNVGRSLLDGKEDLFHETEVERDDFEGADGEVDSETGGQPQEPQSQPLRRPIVSPNERFGGGAGDGEEVDGEVVQATPELQGENRSREGQLDALGGGLHPLQSKSEEFSRKLGHFEARKTDSESVEEDDAASDLGTQSGEIEDEDDDEEDDEAAEQLGPHSEINPLHTQDLDTGKPRGEQGGTLKGVGEAEAIGEDRAGNSKPQLDGEEANRTIGLDSEEISPVLPKGISGGAIESGLPASEVRERVRTEALSEGNGVEDANESEELKPGMGESVLLGALASGVNGPTWFVLRAVLVGLVASLLLLLHVAIKSESTFVLLNVLFLVSIAGGLILLLGWYISEVGLVSVDKQIEELSQTAGPQKVESKTL